MMPRSITPSGRAEQHRKLRFQVHDNTVYPQPALGTFRNRHLKTCSDVSRCEHQCSSLVTKEDGFEASMFLEHEKKRLDNRKANQPADQTVNDLSIRRLM